MLGQSAKLKQSARAEKPITLWLNSPRIIRAIATDICAPVLRKPCRAVVPDYWRDTRCRVELSQLSANIQELVYQAAERVYWANKTRLYGHANGSVTVE